MKMERIYGGKEVANSCKICAIFQEFAITIVKMGAFERDGIF